MEKKYRVIFDPIAFHSDRTEYAPGENVEVSYIMVMTDVSTSFHLNVDEYTRTYENGCYVLRFVMPEHDVDIHASLQSIMTYNPGGSLNTGFMGMGLINDMPAKGLHAMPNYQANASAPVQAGECPWLTLHLK